MPKENSGNRASAFTNFKAAQKMLAEGEAEMAKAQEKIKAARELLEQSAGVIRSTWKIGQDSRKGKKRS